MATIKDIAKLAQVSPGTVSRALNVEKESAVAPETVERVKKIATQLGYRPVQHKASTSATITCALITTLTLQQETEDEYWHFIRKGIYETAKSHSVTIQNIFRIQNGVDPKLVAEYDAIIVMGSMSNQSLKLFKQFNKNIVVIDDVNSDYDFVDTVGTNLYPLTRMALDDLQAEAQGPIAFIGGNRVEMRANGSVEHEVPDPRAIAYHDWTLIHQQPDMSEITDWTSQAGVTAIKRLIDAGQPIGGLLVASDPIAIGVLKGLRDRQLTPGKNLPLISFDGIEVASFLTPALTSIWLPKEELGVAAVNQVLDLLASHRTWSARISIPGKLGRGDTFPIKQA
ncbi:LacI family DNA-binding transcriptional regulator [Secundilactobacillus paracollinoides]|uniref:LacI family DNA-binding transcriptional regulator n=1 Tax=Secundilactobacillus paracollinoides TaxID=240427 RepID=UPI00081A73F4|nr:LacI family DNA-binding transcriptional regulator [Secundilactobacillus paracollinoides]ANZ60298.1 hypothetical protein AYR61_02320 [Secundilactobacillus paracollinoides]